jgi:hypothetical protein
VGCAGAHGGPYRLSSAQRGQSSSSAIRCSRWAAGGCSRARRRRCTTICCGFAALDGATKAYCAHEYTLSNAKFAAGDGAGQCRHSRRAWRKSPQCASAANRPCPTTIATGARDQPLHARGELWRSWRRLRAAKDNF